jgi:hypothetical protein
MVDRKKEQKLASKVLEEEIKIIETQKRRDKIIMSLTIISIIGFLISFLFLVGITGAAIGPTRENFYGLTFILISMLTFAIAELLWAREKKKKEVNIRNLLIELEREGVPLDLLYNKYLKN